MTAVAEPRVDAAATKTEERRAGGVACGAHALHDGYTDLIYVMLPIWQAEFGLSYAAIGLFVSSRTDNQIVALIVTTIIGLLFYFVGSSSLTDFANTSLSEILKGIGTGSRFESIERGVIDLRDLIYYASLTGIFWARSSAVYDRMSRPFRRTVPLVGSYSRAINNAVVVFPPPVGPTRAYAFPRSSSKLMSRRTSLPAG